MSHSQRTTPGRPPGSARRLLAPGSSLPRPKHMTPRPLPTQQRIFTSAGPNQGSGRPYLEEISSPRSAGGGIRISQLPLPIASLHSPSRARGTPQASWATPRPRVAPRSASRTRITTGGLTPGQQILLSRQRGSMAIPTLPTTHSALSPHRLLRLLSRRVSAHDYNPPTPAHPTEPSTSTRLSSLSTHDRDQLTERLSGRFVPSTSFNRSLNADSQGVESPKVASPYERAREGARVSLRPASPPIAAQSPRPTALHAQARPSPSPSTSPPTRAQPSAEPFSPAVPIHLDDLILQRSYRTTLPPSRSLASHTPHEGGPIADHEGIFAFDASPSHRTPKKRSSDHMDTSVFSHDRNITEKRRVLLAERASSSVSARHSIFDPAEPALPPPPTLTPTNPSILDTAEPSLPPVPTITPRTTHGAHSSDHDVPFPERSYAALSAERARTASHRRSTFGEEPLDAQEVSPGPRDDPLIDDYLDDGDVAYNKDYLEDRLPSTRTPREDGVDLDLPLFTYNPTKDLPEDLPTPPSAQVPISLDTLPLPPTLPRPFEQREDHPSSQPRSTDRLDLTKLFSDPTFEADRDVSVDRDLQEDQIIEDARHAEEGNEFQGEGAIEVDEGVDVLPSDLPLPQSETPSVEDFLGQADDMYEDILDENRVAPEVNAPSRPPVSAKDMWASLNKDLRRLSVALPKLPSAKSSTSSRKRRLLRTSKHGIPVPNIPRSLLSSIIRSECRDVSIDKGVIDQVADASYAFFESVAEDLATYAAHGKRRRLEKEDVVCLMRRQRILSGKTTVASLARTHLPRELSDIVSAAALTGNTLTDEASTRPIERDDA